MQKGEAAVAVATTWARPDAVAGAEAVVAGDADEVDVVAVADPSPRRRL